MSGHGDVSLLCVNEYEFPFIASIDGNLWSSDTQLLSIARCVEAQTSLAPWSLTQILKRSKDGTEGRLCTWSWENFGWDVSKNAMGCGHLRGAKEGVVFKMPEEKTAVFAGIQQATRPEGRCIGKIYGKRCQAYSDTNWAVSERIILDSAVSWIIGAW